MTRTKFIILTKYRYLKELVKLLSFERLNNLLKILKDAFLTKISGQIHLSAYPYAATLETSALCNLHCPECPVGMGEIHRSTPLLTIEKFKLLTDQIHIYTFYLNMYFQGEPLVNKEIFKMIDYAHSKRLFTSLSTNAQLITPNVAEKLVKAHLYKIIISIDGTTQQSYSTYRIGGSLAKCIEAIQYINMFKAKYNSPFPIVESQFVVFKHNEHEVKPFKKLSKQMGVNKCTIKSAQIYNFESKEHMIPNSHSRYVKSQNGSINIKKSHQKGCFKLTSTAVITSDLDVVACCYDKFSSVNFGNLTSNSFHEIWFGERAMRFRKHQLKNRSAIAFCQNCPE